MQQLRYRSLNKVKNEDDNLDVCLVDFKTLLLLCDIISQELMVLFDTTEFLNHYHMRFYWCIMINF